MQLQTAETYLQDTDKPMANICRKIFFIIPVTLVSRKNWDEV